MKILIYLLSALPLFAGEWMIDSVTDEVKDPFGVEVGPDGALYITEVGRHVISRLDRSTGTLTIVAGTPGEKGHAGDGGPATEAKLNEPYEVRFDAKGNMYFVEMMNHIIRKVDTKGVISTIAGDPGHKGFTGEGMHPLKAMMNRPHSIALDKKRHHLYVADIGNNRIRRIDLKKKKIITYSGGGERAPSSGSIDNLKWNGPRALFIEGRNLWLALRGGHSVWRIDLDHHTHEHVACTGKKGFSGDGADAKQATMNGPKGIAVGPEGNIYVVDTENQAIRMIERSTGLMHSIAGYGPKGRGYNGDELSGTKAKMGRPHGLCVDAKGVVYVGDTENHRIRRIRRK